MFITVLMRYAQARLAGPPSSAPGKQAHLPRLAKPRCMTHETKVEPPKAVLVGVPMQGVTDDESEESLKELARLVKTLGFTVVQRLTQKRRSLSGGTVLGEGKLAELAKMTGGTGKVKTRAPRKKTKAAERFTASTAGTDPADDLPDDPEEGEGEGPDIPAEERGNVVVFDCELTPSQLANIQSATGAEVLDRTGVIVEIFSRHAKSKIAKLQVEIAKLTYLAPRVRAGGGGDRVGTAGETALELDRRRIRDRIAELKKELTLLMDEQTNKRAQRSQQLSVALVGYTNAGKSSLMRALTGSDVLVEDKLFATLDTTVRTLQPQTIPKILISDTVGFINKLPHDLVASFKSTLDEAENASLLLFVVDASDPSFRAQLNVTQEVLADIGTEDIPRRLVLNKIDLLAAEQLAQLQGEFPDAFFLSTKKPELVSALSSWIVEFFEKEMVDEEILVPYTAQGLVGKIRSTVRVLEETHDENGARYLVRGFPADLARLRGGK
jgi:GTPase